MLKLASTYAFQAQIKKKKQQPNTNKQYQINCGDVLKIGADQLTIIFQQTAGNQNRSGISR